MSGLIDVHAHYVPLGLSFGQTGDSRWPAVESEGETARVLISSKVFRTVRRSAWDLNFRASDLQERGVACQVISPMPELLCYWSAPRQAVDYARAFNLDLAEAIETSEFDYAGLGTLPMQDVEAAVSMLEEVAALGLAGVEIGTSIEGTPVFDPSFHSVFAEACRLGLAVFVHAFHPAYAMSLPRGALAAAATFPPEIAAVGGGLIASGVVAANPGARILLSHGGGGLCATVHRLQHAWTSPVGTEQAGGGPLADFRSLYFDSLTFDSRALEYLVECAGETSVVVGSDYPFSEREIGDTVAGARLSTFARRAIEFDNAMKFIGRIKLEEENG